jgi:hypothetical protein
VRFTYTSEDRMVRQCLTQAVAQGSICWEDVAGAGKFDAARASATVDRTLVELRHLITFELTKVLDQTGEARDWNDAIEAAIHAIENLE